MVSADRGLGDSSHDMSVKVSDIQPKWLLRGMSVVKNVASAPDSSVQATMGIAAVELLEKIQRGKQLWVDATLRIGEEHGSFYCFMPSPQDLPPGPTPRFVALDCPDLLQPDCASTENN
jgi:hypothetical protein